MNEIVTKKSNIHQTVIDLKKEIESNFIKLGGYLKLIRDEKLFKEKGCLTFEEYIGQPELSLNRSTTYAIINVFEVFFEKSNQSDIEELTEIGYSKLNRISQFKEQPDFEEWIYKAKTLSLSDLGAEIKEVKNEKTESKPARKIIEVVCPKCGHKFEIIKE